MLKAIIFDWGGVFISQVPLEHFAKTYTEKHNLDFRTFNEKMVKLWAEAKVSQIDSQHFWSELAQLAGVSAMQLKSDANDFWCFYPEVLAFVQQSLKGKYKLGMITNHIESWFEEHRDERRLDEIFDAIITSYGSRSAKPERKIYEDALSALQVKPQECVFIDDLEKNLPPAQALGMQTILYQNLEQLKADLQQLGVTV